MSSIKDLDRKPKHITKIGGQALIEGVMMRGPKDIGIAVRKPDGEIELKVDPIENLTTRNKFFKLPIIRGVVGLIEAMVLGTKSLMYSAEFFEDTGESEPTKFDKFIEKVFKDKAEDISIYITVFVSILISIGLFMLAPTFVTNFLKNKVQTPILLNLLEGLIRVAIFLIYVLSVSRLEDVKRVFEYHGAEHKTIHCYENEEELTVENVMKYPILHPRCGTSFLFTVMIISILVFSFFGWPSPLQRFISRIVLLPVIAGISYEINRIIGKSNGKFAYIVSYPGLLIQKFATTKEPDASQIEVAIAALKGVLVEDKEADKW
ncbi:protein of unknown function DUF1385 [Gottschalkia acidurici 9a]|uniref:DUF1385 domain-containing protein n=1 Tax=Gottschalkia acidurici (strain ATCC 7906 / DSM 604 / BCRC 14475 / CIP 104303 / KCTC 5404 / NCIMB 10678 / 9a) TaxID=1128398 RepID=K0ATT6_GOTA9|nr:DUF1385 domain-containing protein [Gottschalkia acidurici]AFS77263.1 protein of unknown function DUF1385 [Gottschalkia acidurici 9a]